MTSNYQPQHLYKVEQPKWTQYGVIYQINTRQFSRSGDFNGVIEHLDRLAALGVTTLWIMPIHPIGEVNRKGKLGSPYAVKDYLEINPEFGNGCGGA